ncbi:DUF2892 domain-containing protein [Halobacteriaceae archaeon GCM10025711]
MEKNVGGVDRTARLLLGSVLLLVGLAAFAGYGLGTTGGVITLLVGAVLLFTGTTQKCVINSVLGINTNRP